MKLSEGNVFRSICHSIHRGEGRSSPPDGDYPDRDPCLLQMETPWTESPSPWRQTPAQDRDPSLLPLLRSCCSHRSRQHTSYWNAFGISGGSRISLRCGCQPSGGCQSTILPNFPKNSMKLKEFG